jgi:hypothetical protein
MICRIDSKILDVLGVWMIGPVAYFDLMGGGSWSSCSLSDVSMNQSLVRS